MPYERRPDCRSRNLEIIGLMMISADQFRAMQKRCCLGKDLPWAFLSRYELLPLDLILSEQKLIPWRTQLYRFFKRVMIQLHLVKFQYGGFAWSPRLKHAPRDADAKTVLIWALGYDKVMLRESLLAFKEQDVFKQAVPVILTNVPDFAFYSRLACLVEYVPNMGMKLDDLKSGEVGLTVSTYARDKLAYLAWRYRDAQILECDPA